MTSKQRKPVLIKQDQCPECGSFDLVEHHAAGDVICAQCGVVCADRIVDTEREWREFESDAGSKQKSRVGGAIDPLLGDSQLSTVIGKGDGATSKALARSQIRSSMSGNQRSLLQAFKLIDSMAEKIELPQKIRSRGQEIFKNMEENKAIRGRNTEALAAACLYAACRMEGVPRTFKEICALTNVSKKDIGRAYKFVQKLLNLQVELIQYSDYMNRFCSHLKLPKKIQNYAESVAKKATEMGFVSGRSPITVAASAIFMVSSLTEHKRSQKEIADVTGVSEPTIRNCCKDMEAVRDKLLPKELLGSQSTTEVKS